MISLNMQTKSKAPFQTTKKETKNQVSQGSGITQPNNTSDSEHGETAMMTRELDFQRLPGADSSKMLL
jgi:hypothetical protein